MNKKSTYTTPALAQVSMDLEGFLCSSEVEASMYVDDLTNMSSGDDTVITFEN